MAESPTLPGGEAESYIRLHEGRITECPSVKIYPWRERLLLRACPSTETSRGRTGRVPRRRLAASVSVCVGEGGDGGAAAARLTSLREQNRTSPKIETEKYHHHHRRHNHSTRPEKPRTEKNIEKGEGRGKNDLEKGLPRQQQRDVTSEERGEKRVQSPHAVRVRRQPVDAADEGLTKAAETRSLLRAAPLPCPGAGLPGTRFILV